VYCPVGRALEFSCYLSYRFLLVSVLVSLAYVRQDLLFYACQFHSFQGKHRKGLWSKEDNVLIVRGSISVISSPQQCIQFAHSMSGAVMKQEVESSQIQGPTSLMTVLRHKRIFPQKITFDTRYTNEFLIRVHSRTLSISLECNTI